MNFGAPQCQSLIKLTLGLIEMSALLIIFKIDRNASKTENVTSSLTLVCVSLPNALTQTSSFSLSIFHLIHEAKPYLLPSNQYSPFLLGPIIAFCSR